MNMITLWIVLAAVFLVIELATIGMVSLWFMIGALAALLAAALGAAIWLQILLFVVLSVLCFLLLYPKVKHLVNRNKQATNADMVIGKTCVVTQKIDNVAGTGSVSVDGKIWTARTVNGEIVEPGRLVCAERIEGVKLLVSPRTEG